MSLSAAKRQTRATNQVLTPTAPGISRVANGRNTSVVNAEKKLGIWRSPRERTRRSTESRAVPFLGRALSNLSRAYGSLACRWRFGSHKCLERHLLPAGVRGDKLTDCRHIR